VANYKTSKEMRKYNIREKKFLKLLVNISNQDMELFPFFLQHQYFTEDQNCALFLLHQQSEVLLFIKKTVFDNLDLRKLELRNFIEILSLMGYLKQNRLVDIFPVADNPSTTMGVMYSGFDNIQSTGQNSDITLNSAGTHIKFPDMAKIYNLANEIEFEAIKLENHTYNMIKDNFSGLLFVSEDLKEFVRNGFKSTEDVRYKRAQLTTWIGLLMALIFGIIGIYNPFEKKEIQTHEFNEKQFNEIMRNNNQIHDDLHKIMESHKKNKNTDSLK